MAMITVGPPLIQPGGSHFGSSRIVPRPVAAPVAVAAGSAAPLDCGVSQLCQDAAPQAQEDQWVFVGEGKGNFEQVSEMQPFVGGAWEKKQAPPGGGWTGCAIAGWVATILLVTAFIFAITYSFAGQASGASVARKDEGVSTSFDCSKGLTGGGISDMATAMLTAKFGQADRSSDAKLSAAEIADASRSVYPQCFLPQDQDKDGLVDSSEVVSSYPKAPEDVVFALTDADCDGSLGADELKVFQDPKTIMPSQLKKYLDQADLDDDSQLSKDEFVAAVKQFEKTSDVSALSGYSTWKPEQKEFCCKSQGVGCGEQTPSAPYDCDAGLSSEASWSDAKRGYCCKKTGVGCETSPTYDCGSQDASDLQAWSPAKKEFCCSQYDRGCEAKSEPYDCNAGLSNWERGWSPSKKAWCCKSKKLGCEGEHDCFEDYVTWRTSWGDEKKQFCCRTQGRGCNEAVAPRLIHDCKKDWDHWEETWTAEKQEFCCSNYERGCKKEEQVEQHGDFDCNAGVARWKKGWSPLKKKYCCAHTGGRAGCETAAVAPAERFDCTEDAGSLGEMWSAEKKSWCCKEHQTGCDNKEFDCKAGAWNWNAGWSAEKKVWCCSHENIGCTSVKSHDCEAGWYNWQNVWSAEKKEWCCLREHRGCEDKGDTVKL